MTYLLDTNVVSELMAYSDNVVKRISLLRGEESLYASAITEGELYYGAVRSPEPKRTSLLGRMSEALSRLAGIEPVSREAARAYANIRTDLETRGQPLPDNDIWIAAVAMANEYTLVSHDGAFTRIPGLKLEDWLA